MIDVFRLPSAKIAGFPLHSMSLPHELIGKMMMAPLPEPARSMLRLIDGSFGKGCSYPIPSVVFETPKSNAALFRFSPPTRNRPVAIELTIDLDSAASAEALAPCPGQS